MRDEDEPLRRYLLGEMKEEEESRLEARLIRDEGLFERAETVEAGLLEEYAQGGLSEAQNRRMERHLAVSPATRSQFLMVRGLGILAREKDRVLTGPWGQLDLSRPTARALAAAAMLAIAIPSLWLASRTVPLPRPGHRAIEQRGAAHPKAVEQPAPRPEPVVQPDRVATVKPAPEPTLPEPASWILPIASGVTRGEAGIEEHVLPPGRQRVELRIDLGRDAREHGAFDVVVNDPAAGSPVVQEKGLKVRSIDGRTFLVLTMEADLLPEDFSLEVYGGGETQPFFIKEIQLRRHGETSAPR